MMLGTAGFTAALSVNELEKGVGRHQKVANLLNVAASDSGQLTYQCTEYPA
jgi:hypothetical protein